MATRSFFRNTTRQQLRCLLILFIGMGSLRGMAQSKDSLSLSMAQADSLFLKNNLSLLAERYNVEASKAMIIQARLYPNPSVSFEQSLINSFTRKNYDTDPTRQGSTETVIGVQQLILLAGKRNKQIAMAKISAEMAGYQFYDLLRTLKYTLHSDLINLYNNQRIIAIYESNRKNISQMADKMEVQYQKGFISMNEMVRIRSILFDINQQTLQLNNENQDLQNEIKMLLGIKTLQMVHVLDSLPATAGNAGLLPVQNMIDSAMVYRSDLNYAKANNALLEKNYSYQKSLAVPDLTLGGVYDKSGSYIRDYFGLNVGIDLPVWNRNQGNIRYAKSQLDAGKTQLQITTSQIENDVVTAYNKFLLNQEIIQNIKPEYLQQISTLMDGIIKNYQSKIIGLVEFINYYDSYKDDLVSIHELNTNSLLAKEFLNFTIGKPVIP